jgi:mannose-6-phosphate isomerase-like protein (cupin superfamily)
VSVGFANAGVNEPHLHRETFEVYLVACGSSAMRVEQESLNLAMGDVVVIEPGEAHTLLESSADYHHFVIHVPRRGQALVKGDKEPVSEGRLGLR